MSQFNEDVISQYIGKHAIVRCYASGVHFGVIKAYDLETRHIILTDARCIWWWEKAFTLYAVSQTGISKDSRLTITVPEILLTDAIQILLCSENVTKQLSEMKAYEPE